jgi:hypothetical protein
MAIAVFHVKHHARPDKRGSSRGQTGFYLATNRARGPLRPSVATLTLALGLVLAACSSPADIAAAAAQTPQAPEAPAVPAKTDKVAFTDNANKDAATREFSYQWPAEVSAVPALVTRFTTERNTLLAEQKAEWTESLAEFADDDCGGCVNRSYEKSWDVVADLPRYLSLSASFYIYSGGAHGNGAYDALVWDREAEAALDPKTMFRSPEDLQEALGASWCKSLKVERAERLGPEYADDGFFQCPPIADLTVLAGSSDGKAFNRIGLLAAPYVAGSYAEGTYEVTLPVTPAVLAALKPEYKPAFALAK